jgi:putative copper resistance protein D
VGGAALIVVRFALYLSMMTLFGLSAFGAYGLRTGERGAIALLPWLIVSGGSALLLSAAWVVLMASSMAGTPLWPIDRQAVGGLLNGSAVGVAWKVRMAALGVATVTAVFPTGRTTWLCTVALASGIALGTLAWTGHGAMDEAAIGWLHLTADILHLLAAGIWVGALVGLVLLVSRRIGHIDACHLTLTHRALHGFGAIGTVMVATIVVTGLINGWVLVGVAHIADLASTIYGRLLIAKLFLFAAMLGLAALNRFRLTPSFERAIAAGRREGALGALRASLVAETTCVVAVLGLVAWLGTLASPTAAT